jgi:RHS repeat-associated protein
VLNRLTQKTYQDSTTVEYTYDSFGNQTAASGSLTNFFRYAGREFDTETSLYFYRARYYDPIAGRFNSEDPLEIDGGDLDFYRYVWNDPAGDVDPLGEWGVGVDVGGSVEVGAIAAGAGATGSLGAGVFFNGLHPSAGAMASGGAFAGGPGWGKSAPKCPDKKNFALGAFAGGGLNIFATNAKNFQISRAPLKPTRLTLAGVCVCFQSSTLWVRTVRGKRFVSSTMVDRLAQFQRAAVLVEA